MNNFDICKLSCFIFFIFFVVLFWIWFSIFNVDELRNFVVTLLNCVDEVLVEGLFELTTLSPPFDLKVVGLGLVTPFTPLVIVL